MHGEHVTFEIVSSVCGVAALRAKEELPSVAMHGHVVLGSYWRDHVSAAASNECACLGEGVLE